MEIISPIAMWKEFDRTQSPISTAIISDKTDNGQRMIAAYFDGPTADDGVVRVFAKFFIPPVQKKMPAVVYVPDMSARAERSDFSQFTSRGIAVAVLDLTGEGSEKPFCTWYPHSMSYANYRDSVLCELPADARKNCWVVWAQCMLRGVTFVSSFEFVDPERIAVMGVGVAGPCVWKSCIADAGLAAGAVLFDSKFFPKKTADNERMHLGYEASLSEAAYGGLLKVPIFLAAASNECDDSIDRLSEAYSVIPKCVGSRLSISERLSHTVGYKQRNNIWRWFDYYLNGVGKIPGEPILTATASSHKFYFNVSTPGADGGEVELFVSQGQPRGSLRNWHAQKLIAAGDNEYICKPDIADASKPVYAFVNVYDGGMSVSSPILTRMPESMGVIPSQVIASRLIYESDEGVDDWTAVGTDGETSLARVDMAVGPFGIEGVTAIGGALLTYKLASPMFLGDDSTLLQMSIYSAEKQDAVVTLTYLTDVDGEREEYAVRVSLNPNDGWTKLNLSPGSFTSDDLGMANDWLGIICLRIESEAPVLVKSLLWV